MRKQHKEMYSLEDEFMGRWCQIYEPLDSLQALANKACRRWRVPLIRVRFAKGKMYGAHYSDPPKIELYNKSKTRTGRNSAVLLHEVAHHIETHLFDDEDAHGPRFAAIAMDLYDHYKLIPEQCFKQLAKKHKVRIAKL